MVVIHANDLSTKVLSLLYFSRNDVTELISEANTNAEVMNALRSDNYILMLGHGNQYGLFSKPNKKGVYDRFLITDRHVQFLRGKVCIGLWCYANRFAEKYGLRGLFSGMIISELQEAKENNIVTTKEEIDVQMESFTVHLKYCIDNYEFIEIPKKMLELDIIRSPLTHFNYSHLYFYQ